jgi:flagellar hook-associated protein 3 FlgL
MISTAQFHQKTASTMSTLNERITDLQGQISSGKVDPRASTDPLRALRLSAADDQAGQLTRFAANLAFTEQRLDQADIVLGEGVNSLQRIHELALRATNATASASERATIATEMRALRDQLLGFANARDTTGQPLFGGYRADVDAFTDGPDGLRYRGDAGQLRLQVSESMTMPTGLPGDAVFAGVFDAIDSFIAGLGRDPGKEKAQVTGQDQLRLDIPRARASESWTLALTGPSGTANIRFDLADGAVTEALAAINAESLTTGVAASLDPQTGDIMLTADGPLRLAIIDGPDKAIATRDQTGAARDLVAAGRLESAGLTRLADAAIHLTDQRTKLGALSASARAQADVISGRQVALDRAIANLGDLDMAAALTRLQQQMLNRSAMLQSYAKITQTNLFDYLR